MRVHFIPLFLSTLKIFSVSFPTLVFTYNPFSFSSFSVSLPAEYFSPLSSNVWGLESDQSKREEEKNLEVFHS